MKLHLSTVLTLIDVDGSRRVFTDMKKLEEQPDMEKMNAEIHKRMNWFVNGIAMQQAASIISVSHCIFSLPPTPNPAPAS